MVADPEPPAATGRWSTGRASVAPADHLGLSGFPSRRPFSRQRAANVRLRSKEFRDLTKSRQSDRKFDKTAENNYFCIFRFTGRGEKKSDKNSQSTFNRRFSTEGIVSSA